MYTYCQCRIHNCGAPRESISGGPEISLLYNGLNLLAVLLLFMTREGPYLVVKTVLSGFPARTGPRADKKSRPWPAGGKRVTRGIACRAGPRATLDSGLNILISIKYVTNMEYLET